MKTHDLKILPEYFKEVLSGKKPFEIRKNDRNFEVNDLIVLHEYDAERQSYTGRFVKRQITYVTDYAQKGNYVVLGLKSAVTKEEFNLSLRYIHLAMSFADNDQKRLKPGEYQELKEKIKKVSDYIQVYFESQDAEDTGQTKELSEETV